MRFTAASQALVVVVFGLRSVSEGRARCPHRAVSVCSTSVNRRRDRDIAPYLFMCSGSGYLPIVEVDFDVFGLRRVAWACLALR